MKNIREEAQELIENFPESATWDVLIYTIYVRKKIEDGRMDANKGKLIPHEEVKKWLKKKLDDLEYLQALREASAKESDFPLLSFDEVNKNLSDEI